MATTIPPSIWEDARSKVSAMFSHIRAQGDADYIGEPVSQLAHTLQAGHLAATCTVPPSASAVSKRDLILAALLHDIGRFIPEADVEAPMIDSTGTYVGRMSHEVTGEQYLRGLGFSDAICQIVGAHVWAKRYLCKVDQGYWEALSKSSKTTLEFQGGIFNDKQVKEAQADPLLEAKLAVRRWDDQAKVPGMKVAPLEDYEDMAVQSLIDSGS